MIRAVPSAFPRNTRVDTWTDPDGVRRNEVVGGSDGMSLRDYFAAKAMQAMLCADSDNGRLRDGARRTAEFAYEVADAMLKARGPS